MCVFLAAACSAPLLSVRPLRRMSNMLTFSPCLMTTLTSYIDSRAQRRADCMQIIAIKSASNRSAVLLQRSQFCLARLPTVFVPLDAPGRAFDHNPTRYKSVAE